MAFKNLCICLILCLTTLQCANSLKLIKGIPEIKKILIIGATGQAGSPIVKEALDRGIQVKAFSRNPSKLAQDVRDKVEAVTGDIQNYDDIQKAVKGVDAVIVVISPRSLEDTSNYMAKGVQNVVKAMKAENVEIVNVVLSDFILMPPELVPEMFRIEIVDQRAMYDALNNSDLKYIATCPADYTKTPSNAYEVKNGGMPGDFKDGPNLISLNQLAKFFIDSLSQPEHYRQLVGIRNLKSQ